MDDDVQEVSHPPPETVEEKPSHSRRKRSSEVKKPAEDQLNDPIPVSDPREEETKPISPKRKKRSSEQRLNDQRLSVDVVPSTDDLNTEQLQATSSAVESPEERKK